jgi:signal-transduction protein with cAMP-binding, CBS, and nucleotidyltransferase domain
MARLPLVSPIERALFLKAQPYLEGLSSSVLAVLASYTEERFYPAGAVIREASSPVERVVFLGSGAVEVAGPSDLPPQVVRIEAPGAIGLSHHFAGAESPPRIRAVVDTLCLELATVDLDQILEDHFPLLLEMARTSCAQAVLTFKSLGDARPPEAGFEKVDSRETPVSLDLVQRLARAKHAPFFHETNLAVLSELFRFDTPQRMQTGERLWAEGDPVDEMALVLDGGFRTEGRFGVRRAPSGATLGAWEILDEPKRFEGWVAEAPSRVLPIRKDLFIDVLEDHFEFAQGYLQRVSQKILDGWDAMARTGAVDARASKASQP